MNLNHKTVKELSKQITEARIKIRDARDTLPLDKLIINLNLLVKSKSKNLVDYSELESDIRWLKKYYKEHSWNDVTRWLTNIDSSIREVFSCYIDAIKALNNSKKDNKKDTELLDKKEIVG